MLPSQETEIHCGWLLQIHGFPFKATMPFSALFNYKCPGRVINISCSHFFCLILLTIVRILPLIGKKIALVKVTMTCQLLNSWSVFIPISIYQQPFHLGDHPSSFKHFLNLAQDSARPLFSVTSQGHPFSLMAAWDALFSAIMPGARSSQLSSPFSTTLPLFFLLCVSLIALTTTHWKLIYLWI